MRLEDKVAIITGAAKGIGKAIALRFAKEGAKIVIADNDILNGQKLIKEIENLEIESYFFETNIKVKSEIDKMIDFTLKKFQRLDIMVANAGICPFEEFLNIDEKLFDKVIAVNQKGAFFSAQSAMKAMIEKNIKGKLIFTSSVSSIFGGKMQSHYCATKGAVNQIMKSIAIAAGPYGITVNAVLPGTVITDINRQQLESEEPELKEYFIKRTPLGRLATPEDIAGAMLFFASADANCITGTTLIVDGGMSINLQ